MSQKAEFHNLAKPDDGLLRELAKGVTTRIFAGEQAMLSVVTIAPNAQGVMHHHPEEQWGVLLEGSAVRFQGGEEIAVRQGDFWRTPGNVPHTMRAGPTARACSTSSRRQGRNIRRRGRGLAAGRGHRTVFAPLDPAIHLAKIASASCQPRPLTVIRLLVY